MKAFGRALRVDLRRSILSGSFVWITGLLLIWLLINSSAEITMTSFRSVISVPQVFNSALSNVNGFSFLLPALASMGYGWSHCLDTQCGFRFAATERIGIRAYVIARVLSAVLSAFLAAAISSGIYLIILCSLDFAAPQPEYLRHAYAYLNFVAEGQLTLYYVVRIFILGLACGLFSVFSLLVSAYIPNVYLSILSPIIAFYAWYVICASLYLNVVRLDCIIFGQTFSSETWSFIWAVEVLLVLTALCGYLFYRRLRKEQGA